MPPLDREKDENIMTTSRTITDAEWDQLTSKARELGDARGRADGEAFPIQDEQHARRLLIAITGDELNGQGLTQDQFDTVMDDLPSAPLSGEFGGDPTPHTLYEQLGVTADDDTDDSGLCQAYEDGHGEGVSSMVAQRCRDMLNLPDDGELHAQPPGLVISLARLEAWAGRPVTSQDIARLDAMLGESSIPDAFRTMFGVIDDAIEPR